MQADKDSLPMQRKDLVQYADLILRTDQYVIFEDAGYSGKNTERPAYQDMMARIRKHEFTHLLVWKIDRISRNLLDFAGMYQELKRLDVTFVSKNESFDTSTAMGEAMLKIILVFAELERNMTSERVRATMISRAKAGKWNGGPVPFGYNYDEDAQVFTVNPAEGDVVRSIFSDYLRFRSTSIVVRRLASQGIRRRDGEDFTTGTISRMLRNPFYVGDYRYNRQTLGAGIAKDNNSGDWVTVRNHHPAIISREDFAAVGRLLTSNGFFNTGELATRNYTTRNTHVFGGLIVCGRCGKTMYCDNIKREGKQPRSRYYCINYRHGTCTQTNATDYRIGDFVLNFIMNVLYARDHASSIRSTGNLQKVLLHGRWFKAVESINADALQDILSAIHDAEPDVFGRGQRIAEKKKPETGLLKARITKLRGAVSRLTDLYIFSPDSITQEEYIEKKKALQDEAADLERQLAALEAEAAPEIDDDEFIRRASEFVITQELSGERHTRYQPLSERVEPEVLRDFFTRILSRIVVDGPRIEEIDMQNGIAVIFTYKDTDEQ